MRIDEITREWTGHIKTLETRGKALGILILLVLKGKMLNRARFRRGGVLPPGFAEKVFERQVDWYLHYCRFRQFGCGRDVSKVFVATTRSGGEDRVLKCLEGG